MQNHTPFLFCGEFVNSNRNIYTPSIFARTNLLHLQEVGELTAVKPHVSSRKDLNSYLFFMVTDGFGTLTYDGAGYDMKKGDCGFIDCHRQYSHQSSENNLWTLKWIHFFGSNMGGIYDKYLERGGKYCFHSENFLEYEALVTKIQMIAESDSYIKDMEIAEKLMSILTLLMSESWNLEIRNRRHAKRQDMMDVKVYLDKHFTEKIKLENLAAVFFVSKYYLLRCFKEQFGITVNAYLIQKRITLAKQLLRFSEQNIEQIAEACGMSDANYFTRIFKNMEGITPGEYRKRW